MCLFKVTKSEIHIIFTEVEKKYFKIHMHQKRAWLKDNQEQIILEILQFRVLKNSIEPD